ncbi:hypothetical protein HK098_007481 [Nowakowskiella sp. JEL0407]|nr:hypothetical protein HK098_007481 [Nowakowskiella sp. JEL0407]
MRFSLIVLSTCFFAVSSLAFPRVWGAQYSPGQLQQCSAICEATWNQFNSDCDTAYYDKSSCVKNQCYYDEICRKQCQLLYGGDLLQSSGYSSLCSKNAPPQYTPEYNGVVAASYEKQTFFPKCSDPYASYEYGSDGYRYGWENDQPCLISEDYHKAYGYDVGNYKYPGVRSSGAGPDIIPISASIEHKISTDLNKAHDQIKSDIAFFAKAWTGVILPAERAETIKRICEHFHTAFEYLNVVTACTQHKFTGNSVSESFEIPTGPFTTRKCVSYLFGDTKSVFTLIGDGGLDNWHYISAKKGTKIVRNDYTLTVQAL